MLRIVLYQPEIPPNTGNIIRLCANTGCSLHLIGPLGFELDDRRMRRAGLDYREYADVRVYTDLAEFMARNDQPQLYGVTTRATRYYHQVEYRAGDALLFGPETRGLPADLLAQLGEAATIRIPMLPHSRSLNLSNAAALVAYEGLRQLGFQGLV
ncbi:MAG: tRNA (cytidine(34)-2'-O)-methyltransferase [Halieaceae bacterium]|jgi:tRNA (cytidine/uridine-2'-O-)-methyltransferase|nr:tRNA (cytidine(34)-2'-O)-methyltransferase [Halieaceae bacterium]